MLPADTEGEGGAGGAATGHSDADLRTMGLAVKFVLITHFWRRIPSHHLPHSIFVEGLKGVPGQDPGVNVMCEELGLWQHQQEKHARSLSGRD